MRGYILSTGDELVRGRTRDRNTAEIARALSEHGFTVVGATLVGDDLDALRGAILRAAEAADVIVMSGGLGPTEDDCTRAAAAAAAGVGLERSEEAVRYLHEMYAARGRSMPDSNLRQADMPAGAESLPNDYGTAPGFRLSVRSAQLFALPGPPREMRGVLAEQVLPRLSELRGEAARVVRTRVIETFGEREAAVGERIAELMRRGARPRVGTSAQRGTIRVVIHAEGAPSEVDAGIERVEAEIRRRLGRCVFGADGDTLPEVVGRLLLERGVTIATAESCTGGLLAGALTEIPGISAVFPGGVVAYSNEQKIALLGVPAATLAQVGAVSEEVALALAAGVREKFGTDVGVGVTGIAGPGGGTQEKPVGLVHVALDVRGRPTHRRLTLPGDRALIRELTVKSALDLVRRSLDREPAGPGCE